MPSRYRQRINNRYGVHMKSEQKAIEPEKPDITLSDWAQEWLVTYKSGVAYNTREMYRIMVNVHIVPAMGHIKLKDIRPYHIQKLINDKYAAGKTRTVGKVAQTVKQIFNRAVENHLVQANPAQFTVMPKIVKEKKRALTQEEQALVLKANLDAKSKAFLLTLLYAGLRKGEALALTRDDIDLEKKTITVSKSLFTKGNTPEIKLSPKTNAGNRVIPIPNVLVEAFADYLADKSIYYVFPSASNELMTKTAFRRFWEKILRRLNQAMGGGEMKNVLASDITPHIFRHTYATLLFYAGVDLKAAQYLLGHASVNVTLEIYTHLDTEKTRSASDKLNALISGTAKNK